MGAVLKLKIGPKFGVLPAKNGAEKHAFWRDFRRLRTSIANISGKEQDIDNRKTALQTIQSLPRLLTSSAELRSTNGEK